MKAVNVKSVGLSAVVAFAASFLLQFIVKGNVSGALHDVAGMAFPLVVAWLSGVPFNPTIDLDGDGKPDFPKK